VRKYCWLVLLLLPVVARSQDSVYHQALYWIRYQNQWTINPKWYWVNEGENRRFFSPDEENQLITHTHIHRRAGQWDVGAGMTFSWIYAQFPERGYEHAVSEVRPFVEVAHELPIGKAFIQNKLRVDNRFFEIGNDAGVLEDYYYVTRIRYRLQFRFILKGKEDKPVIGMRLADEIMFHTKQNVFDQNRVQASVDFLVIKSLSLEAGYVYLFQQRAGRSEYFSRQVVRFTIYHRI
jgi:hypothetical protein